MEYNFEIIDFMHNNYVILEETEINIFENLQIIKKHCKK